MGSRRRTVMWIVAGSVAAALVCVGLWWHCWARFEARWERVKVGMTEEEVKAILGEPTNVYSGSEVNPWWEYKSEHRTLTFGGRFPWVRLEEWPQHGVDFGSDGRVEGKWVGPVWVSIG